MLAMTAVSAVLTTGLFSGCSKAQPAIGLPSVFRVSLSSHGLPADFFQAGADKCAGQIIGYRFLVWLNSDRVAESGWFRRQMFDEIAKCLAQDFHTSELSFEFCDAVVNDLFGPVTNTSGPKPEVFWDVYSAFDEGEYYHGNNRDEDPVETYTRTMIDLIVRETS